MGWGIVAGCGAGRAGEVTPPAQAAQPPAQGGVPADEAIGAAAREVRAGRPDEALRLIREQAGKHPEWSPPRVILARLLFDAGQAPAGRRALEQAVAELPDNPDVYLSFGALALTEGRLSDAKLNFEKAQALIGSGKWADERARGFRREVAAGLAAVAEAREDWESARRWLTALLEIEPKNGPMRQRLGRALFNLDKVDEAFAALKQAVQDTPALDPAAVAMGWLYTQKADRKKAEEWFDSARKLEPQNARVHRARAAWLLDQGRTPEAKAAVEEAAKLEPGAKDGERLRALIAWHLGDAAEAQRILEPLHREAPADFAVANLLALSLVDQDDKDRRARGLQLAEVDARQSPRSADAIATFGWALYRSGRVDQAEQALRQAVSGARTTPDIAYYLARVLADKGHNDDARKLLQSATGLTGAFAHRKDADALLKSLPR
jgi:tetratricopeptide (TPR) repeat protein